MFSQRLPLVTVGRGLIARSFYLVRVLWGRGSRLEVKNKTDIIPSGAVNTIYNKMGFNYRRRSPSLYFIRQDIRCTA